MGIWSLDEHSTWRDILRFAGFQGDREWVYIITGKSGPTGKTFLYEQLKKNGYNAIEISEDMVGLVIYQDTENHYFVDHAKKTLLIVLNKPIYTKGSKPWNGRKDFTMKKEFTKKDLKNGDVVKYRNGLAGVICLDTGAVIMDENEFMYVNTIRDDLTHASEYENADSSYNWDIVAVRRPSNPGDCRPCAFKHEFGTLVYERKEVEEMTLDEICKALGKEIKIVKEK